MELNEFASGINAFYTTIFVFLSCMFFAYLMHIIITKNIGALIYKYLKKSYRYLTKKHFKKRYKTVKELTNKKYLYRIKKVAVSNNDNECLKVSIIKESNHSVKIFEVNYFKKEPELRIYKTKEKTKIIHI